MTFTTSRSPAETSTSDSTRPATLRAFRFRGVSSVWRGREVAVVLLATITALVVATISVGIGDYSIDPLRVIQVLAGQGDPRDELVVIDIRLPRVLVGLVVGAAMGLAGAIVQTTVGNPLASPDLLGVTAGASVGAVAVIALGGTDGVLQGFLNSLGVPLAALLGGLGATVLVLLVLRRTGTSGLQTILVGIGVSALLGGVLSWLMIAASIDDVARANVWLNGSLNGRSWTELWSVTAILVLAIPVLMPLAARLTTLSLGHDVASSLGIPVGRSRMWLLLIGVLLTSATTAAAGPIAFVALVSPHIARLTCATHRPPLIASAALGALLVSGSDLIARTALSPIQIPVGAVTAIVGAPFLLWLLIQRRRKARL